MEEKIQNLFEKLRDISAAYMIYRQRDNVERIQRLIPDIQEFVIWFLGGNQFAIEDDLYAQLSDNLIHILQDILTALERADKVLLHDAVAYGLLEYLEMFIEPGQEET